MIQNKKIIKMILKKINTFCDVLNLWYMINNF